MPVVKCRSCRRDFTVADHDPQRGELCPHCHEASTMTPTSGTAPIPPSAPEVPMRIPGYEIQGELGRGGMGVVYKARQTALNRLVALKVILVGAHATASERARFRTEAETVARLRHPNILQVYDLGESAVPGSGSTLPYLSLEFCAGGGLDKRLKSGPLSPQLAAGLIETLARAVHHAHESKVIHRDLKPANVLFDEKGVPKLADFGLAKKLDEQGHTRTGTVMGTPAYVSPEQAAGKVREIGPATDVYSLGAILYECLSGRPPFRGETAMDTLLSVVTEPVPTLPQTIPLPLQAICQRCLQKRPQDRYPTAQALADDLRRYLGGQRTAASFVAPPLPQQVAARPSSMAGWLLGVLALLVLSLVGVSAFWMMNDETKKLQDESDNGKNFEPPFRLPDVEGEWKRLEAIPGGADSLAFAPDGRHVAIGGGENVWLWDLRGDEKPVVLKSHDKKARDGDDDEPVTDTFHVVFNRDGKWLLSSSRHDSALRLWDVRKREEWKRFDLADLHDLRAAGVFTADDGRIVAGAKTSLLSIDVQTGATRYHRDVSPVWRVAPRPGTNHVVLLVGDRDPALKLFDLSQDRAILTYDSPRRVLGVAVTADGSLVVCGCEDDKVRLFDAGDGKLTHQFEARLGGRKCMALSARGTRLVTAGKGAICVWNVSRDGHSQEAYFSLTEAEEVAAVAISPDGRHFATSAPDGSVRIWGVSKAKR